MANAPRFSSGKPCKRGHTSFRLVSSGACCECLREANRTRYEEKRDHVLSVVNAYRANNPEAVKKSRAGYESANAEEIRLRDRVRFVGERKESAIKRLADWTKSNPELKRAQTAAWAAANPEKVAAKAAKRRAAVLQRTPPWADLDAISGMYELAQLFRATGMQIEVDHAVPLQGRKVSGLHVHDNLQLISSFENRSKSNRFAVL